MCFTPEKLYSKPERWLKNPSSGFVCISTRLIPSTMFHVHCQESPLNTSVCSPTKNVIALQPFPLSEQCITSARLSCMQGMHLNPYSASLGPITFSLSCPAETLWWQNWKNGVIQTNVTDALFDQGLARLFDLLYAFTQLLEMFSFFFLEGIRGSRVCFPSICHPTNE